MTPKKTTYYLCSVGDTWREHPLLDALNAYVRVADPRDAAVLIANAAPQSLREFHRVASPKHLRVFLGGEAVVPDFNLFDYAFGFSRLDFGSRYLRISPWVFHRASFQKAGLVHPSRSSALGLSHSQRKAGSSFIYSNRRAHPMRDTLFYHFSSAITVNSLGKHLTNAKSPLAKKPKPPSWLKERVEIENHYRFSLALENARFDGYTSEKLIASLFAGSVPIYWGNPSVGFDFNINRFIVIEDTSDVGNAIKRVLALNEDEALWSGVVSSPWFTEGQRRSHAQDHLKIEAFWKRVFEDGFSASSRRGLGTYPLWYELQQVRAHGSPTRRLSIGLASQKQRVASLLRSTVGKLRLFLLESQAHK